MTRKLPRLPELPGLMIAVTTAAIINSGDLGSHGNSPVIIGIPRSLGISHQKLLKASSSSVFCSISCAACEPVEGLEDGERLTERSGLPRASRSNCGAR